MVIQKVHGLHATSMTMNDRFTLLASAAPGRAVARPPRRQLGGNILMNNRINRNRNLITQIARRLQQQAERIALRQRLGYRQGMRQFGSESNLPGLRRSNSWGNLSQTSVKNRVSWQPNGGLRRSASFGNLFGGSLEGKPLRGFRRRGGGQRALRGRFGNRGRGGRQNAPPATNASQQQKAQGANKPQTAKRGRGVGRGGISRNQTKTLPTKEELDNQLDEYMASSKWALDQELDTYMRNAMELE